MTLVDSLISKASEYLPEDRIGIVMDAYRFAVEKHDGQRRWSGEPFIEHPLHTAIYLTELRLDPNSLAAGLLHDVMEDCGVTFGELTERFGEEIAKLVEGVTKLTQTELMPEAGGPGLVNASDNDAAKAANLRKLLLSMGEDVRVVLIKLADRLHNMKTLKALPKNRRLPIAHETLDVYAPLAHRLGIWEIKWQLEDLAFQYINPEAYKEVSRLLSAKRVEREEYIGRIIALLKKALDEADIEGEVWGRPKHIYSIHKKMARYAAQHREVGEIYDLFALRVIVNTVKDCYAALGVVHGKWRPLPGQFDDYIANPKDNLYQSLHTAVLCEGAAPVEVQIRTHEMHRLAEYGVAAHWMYKEDMDSDERFESKMTWLRQLLDWQREIRGDQEFLESFKKDIFENQVFVYTPRGDLKELPVGSTPLDFAFRVHTDIGVSAIGAKVNGKLVPLQYELRNGDTVEILNSESAGGPSPEWLNPNLGYVKTAYARERIRQWFNRQTRKTNVGRGRDIFNNQLRRLDTSLRESDVAEAMDFDTTDDFYAALGSGDISTSQVIDRLTSHEIQPDSEQTAYASGPSIGPASGIEVLGVGDLLPRIARCCNPIRGDEIIGHITHGRGVVVHRASCPNILGEKESSQLVQVRWGKTQTLYPVRIKIEGWDRVGLLRDITSLVSGEHVNISFMVSEEAEDTSVITLTVYVDGIDRLSRLFAKLEGVEGVISVSRVQSRRVAAQMSERSRVRHPRRSGSPTVPSAQA